MQYRQKLLHLPARLGLLAGLVVALLLAFGGQPFSLGRSKPIATVGGQGYWLLAKDGGLFAYGDATYLGNNLNSNADIIGIARTPTLRGYWAADDDGTVFPFGDAQDYGSRISTVDDIRGFAARPQGDGYWLVTKDGLVIPKGAAAHLGNTPPGNINQKIVGMEATPSGNGYWIVGRDGGIFAFGDAPFYGSTGAIVLNKPIASMSRTESGLGYRFVASDGGVFNYGDALFYGSTGANPPASTIVDLAATASGSGYWLVAGNGKVYPFGDANSYGDASNLTLRQPMVGIAATPIVRVNSIPAATNDSATLGEDGSTTVDVLGSDSGLGDGPMSVAITRAPTHGSASVGSDGRITYTPATNYHGSDSLTYKVTDADGESSSATLSFTVSSRNDPAIASNVNLSTNEDTAKSGNLPASDADGDNLSYSKVSGPAHGTLTVNTGSGAFSYTPAPNYNGPDSFTFRANDGSANSNTGTVRVTVNPANDIPVANNQTLPVTEDITASGHVTGSDVDGDSLAYGPGSTLPTKGTRTVNADGSFTYVPNPNQFGLDSFTFTATDSHSAAVTGTVSVDIAAVNDAATVSTVSDQTIDEDTNTGALAFTVGDVETAPGSLTVTAASSDTTLVPNDPANLILGGTDASRTITVYPVANGFGSAIITLSVTDGGPATTSTFTVTVTPVNDIPVVDRQTPTTLEDTPILNGQLTGSDVEGDSLTWTLAPGGGTTNGAIVVNSDGSFTYTPTVNSHGEDHFTVIANDATDASDPVTITIHVTPVNDAATVSTVSDQTIDEDTNTGALAFTVGDVESDPGSLTVTAASSDTTLVPNDPANLILGGTDASRTITVYPVANGFGSSIITLSVTDGGPATTSTFKVTVTFVDDIPVAVADTAEIAEDNSVDVDVLANDTGLGDGGLEVTILTSDLNGTWSEVDNKVRFEPTANWSGTATFSYRVVDGDNDSSAAGGQVTVTAVNDAPTITSSGFTELMDEDTSGSGFVQASDVDSPGPFTYSASSTNPTLIDSADFTFNPFLGSEIVNFAPKANQSGEADITITVQDGSDSLTDSATTSFHLVVDPVNDAPVFSAPENQSIVEDNSTGALGVSVSDVDTTHAQVAVTATSSDTAIIPDANLDVQSDGVGNWTVDATPAADRNGGPVTITLIADDGTGSPTATTTHTFTVTVGSVNDVPVANDDSESTPENTPVTVDVLANDVLGDDPLVGDQPTSVELFGAGPVSGTALVVDNQILYTPALNFNGTVCFDYLVSDSVGSEFDTGRLCVEVSPVNDAPTVSVIVDTSTSEDTPTGELAFTIADSDSPVAAVTLSGHSSDQAVVADSGIAFGGSDADRTVTVTPVANANGPVTITVTATDNHDPAAHSDRTFVLTVDPVNDAPFFPGDGTVSGYTVAPVTSPFVDISPAGTDIGNHCDDCSTTVALPFPIDFYGTVYSSAAVGSNGLLALSGPNHNYENESLPSASLSRAIAPMWDDLRTDFGGVILTQTLGTTPNRQFVVQWNNLQHYSSSPGTVTFQVVLSEANHDILFRYQDVTFGDGNDGGASATVGLNMDSVTATQFSSGTNSLSDGLALKFTADSGYTLTTPEDTTGSAGFVATDVDGDVLEYSMTSPGHGTASIHPATAVVAYNPDADYHGPDAFTVSVTDHIAPPVDQDVTVTVTAVNDAPVATGTSLTMDEDTSAAGSVTATDIDSALVTFTLDPGNSPAKGTAIVALDGQFTYQPNPDANGADSFIIIADDLHGGTAPATVLITINPVNDAPVASNSSETVAEDGLLNKTVVASDVDNDPLSYTVTTPPTDGTLTGPDASGDYTYDPDANFNGTDTFTFTANDGTADSDLATVTITIDPMNDAPVASDSSETVAEDGLLIATVVASDVDGDPLSHTVVTAPTDGTVTGPDVLGAYTYDPDADFNGTDTFTFTANDGTSDSNLATVTITVTPGNDPPVATGTSLTMDEDAAAATGSVTATDIDTGDVVTFTLDPGNSPAKGTAIVALDGQFTYQPNRDANGADSFIIIADDGHGGTDPATVSITINPMNDAPVATDLTVESTTGDPVTIDLNELVSDVDGDPLTFTLMGAVATGTINCDASGVCTYTPPSATFLGSATFTYKANDGTADSNLGTVTINYGVLNV